FAIESPDVASWSPDAWQQIADAWHDSRRAWDQVGNIGYANFPVVESANVPVRSLLSFMLGFVVLVGPVNVYWLSRKNRRIWLLWTVPVFSLLTTFLLFGYVAMTDGWHPHFRGLSITVLDENDQRASTVGWLGYYSPTTAPRLHFSADTEISAYFEP